MGVTVESSHVRKAVIGSIAAMLVASTAWAASTLVDHGERVAVLESRFLAIQKGQERIFDGMKTRKRQQEILKRLDAMKEGSHGKVADHHPLRRDP